MKKYTLIIENTNDAEDDWHVISKAFKDLRKEKRINHFDNRLENAKKLFKKNNIPYKLCNEEIGHFNLLDDKGKVLMSYWSYTGKCYIPSKKFSNNVGIQNCIKMYKKETNKNGR